MVEEEFVCLLIQVRWEGVRNYQARNYIRAMNRGDQGLFYHSHADPPAIVGVVEVIKQTYRDLQQQGRNTGFHESSNLEQASLTDLLQELIQAGHEVHAVCTYKGWMDVDSFEDYQKAWVEIS